MYVRPVLVNLACLALVAASVTVMLNLITWAGTLAMELGADIPGRLGAMVLVAAACLVAIHCISRRIRRS